jgi:hypothetical protein
MVWWSWRAIIDKEVLALHFDASMAQASFTHIGVVQQYHATSSCSTTK